MFVLKKFLAPLFSPVSVCLELMVAGLLLLAFSRRTTMGKWLLGLGTVVFVICSYQGLSGRILSTLESEYPPLDLARFIQEADADGGRESVKWIVVLAGGVAGDTTLPVQLQISHYSRVRLVEGIRLHHVLPGSKLVLTGGIGFDGPPEATILSRVAQELGVMRADMVLEVESRDTKDHPLYVRHIVRDDPFILVTSAFHMPRAMRLFLKQGLQPIPAPVGQWKPPREFWSPSNLFPSASGLRLAELAYHEYMGLLWAWVRGQI